MHQLRQLKPLALHAPMWISLQPYIRSKNIPHALFFAGPRHASLLELASAFMAAVMCANKDAPCGTCTFCENLSAGTCTDVHEVRLETASTVIKIDQIRALHPAIDQSPQRGSYRFVLIEPADKLNLAASNALLKILEEPADRTFFILISEQLTGLPLTLLSRCQCYIFGDQAHLQSNGHRDYLGLGLLQHTTSARTGLCAAEGLVMQSLLEMLGGRITVCSIAASLASYPLDEVLWFLYLLMAQAIYDKMLNLNTSHDNPVITKIRALSVDRLFQQLNKIVLWMKHARDDTRLNQTLAIEAFLLDFFVETGTC